MAAVRHGTVTIEFDPTRLTGPATIKVSPHDEEPFDVVVPMLDLLGVQAKLCTRLGQLATQVHDAAKQHAAVRNDVGDVHGVVVQTRDIRGGVHIQ